MRPTIRFFLVSLLALLAFAPTGHAQRKLEFHQAPFDGDFQVVNDSVIVDYSGTISRSTNYGNTWTSIGYLNHYGDIACKSVFYKSESQVIGLGYALTYPAGSNHQAESAATWGSSDSGRTWSGPVNAQYADYLELSLLCQRDSLWFIAYSSANLGPRIIGARLGNTGQALVPPSTSTPYIQSIDMGDSGIAMAGTLYDESINRIVSGVSKSVLSDSVSGICASVWHLNGASWIAALSHRVVRSDDNGATWNTLLTRNESLLSMSVFHKRDCYLLFAGKDYYLYSSDTGKTWITRGIPFGGQTWKSFAIPGSDRAYLIGNSAVVSIRNEDGRKEPAFSTISRTIDFGLLNYDSDSSRTITIWNKGDTILTVSGVDAQTSRVFVTPSTFTLKPGDSIQVTIYYRTINPFRESLYIHFLSDNPLGYDEIVVLGQAKIGVLSAQPDTVDFGIVQLGESQRKWVQLKNLGLEKLRITSQASNDPQFSSGVAISIDSLGSKAVSINFAPVRSGPSISRLIYQNSGLKPDTVYVRGIGVVSRDGPYSRRWVSTIHNDKDTNSNAAYSMICDSAGVTRILHSGHDEFQKSHLYASSMAKSGALFRSAMIDSTPPMYDGALVSDGLEGFYALSAGYSLYHLNDTLGVDWKREQQPQIVAGPFLTAIEGEAIVALSERLDRPNSQVTEIDLGSIDLWGYGPKGDTTYQQRVDGTSTWYYFGPQYDGKDYPLSVGQFGSSAFITLALDNAPHGQYKRQDVKYELDVVELRKSPGAKPQLFQLQSISGQPSSAPIAADNSGVYVAALIGGQATVYHISNTGALVWSSPVGSFQNLSDVVLSKDSLAVVGTIADDNTDVRTVIMSKLGGASKSSDFDGLASLSDYSIKSFNVPGGFATLVNSQDTVGSDWIVWVQSWDGREIARLRYAANGRQQTPVELDTHSDIRVIGSSANASGKMDPTIIHWSKASEAVKKSLETGTLASATIYPNPASTALRILASEIVGNLRATDALGRTVEIGANDDGAYDVSSLSPGTYTLVGDTKLGPFKARLAIFR